VELELPPYGSARPVPENGGVPGSNPGLAIRKLPANEVFSGKLPICRGSTGRRRVPLARRLRGFPRGTGTENVARYHFATPSRRPRRSRLGRAAGRGGELGGPAAPGFSVSRCLHS
jgi:hypothetical protein